MKRTIHVLGMLVVLGAILVGVGGCLLAAAGAAGGAIFAYADGELTAQVNGNPQQVIEAAKLTMKELDMPVLSAYADGLEGRLEARLGTDNKAIVKAAYQAENSSKINIRIGTFGDETRSKQILERIRLNLKQIAGRMPAGNL